MAIFFVPSAHSSITKSQYDSILDEIYEAYKPKYSNAKAVFKINRSWDNPKVNAKARIEGNNWIIDMWGGYPKHEMATVDGFYAFTCHEIGHHFGGFPFWNEPNALWASAEGQADYFVTTKCLRMLWKTAKNKTALENKKIEPLILNSCSEQFKNQDDYYLCVRSANAGYEMLAPLAYKFENLSVAKPNLWVTTFTFVNQHPGDQCRLDTLFQGALCQVDEREDFDSQDETIGACSRLSGHDLGVRPRCWFLPRGY